MGRISAAAERGCVVGGGVLNCGVGGGRGGRWDCGGKWGGEWGGGGVGGVG